MGSNSMKMHPFVPASTSFSYDAGHASSGAAASDLKSFIRPDSGPRKPLSSSHSDQNNHSTTHKMETQSGGTRWSPTQEQIGILEMLYRGGMRTPNAQQIEQITEKLAKYGKIEGKNIFYWFQNHKARERQKQKRNLLGLGHSPRTPSPATRVKNYLWEEESQYKKRSRFSKYEFQDGKKHRDDGDGDKTLELFPQRPESR